MSLSLSAKLSDLIDQQTHQNFLPLCTMLSAQAVTLLLTLLPHPHHAIPIKARKPVLCHTSPVLLSTAKIISTPSFAVTHRTHFDGTISYQNQNKSVVGYQSYRDLSHHLSTPFSTRVGTGKHLFTHLHSQNFQPVHRQHTTPSNQLLLHSRAGTCRRLLRYSCQIASAQRIDRDSGCLLELVSRLIITTPRQSPLLPPVHPCPFPTLVIDHGH